MTMALRLISYLLLTLVCGGTCYALEMNVAVQSDEKLVYVNLWGQIDQGDDEKFRLLILPYVKDGYLIWQVNIFSVGGNVGAAMGLGDQIRTLQTRTETAYNEAKIINNRQVITGRTSCTFREKTNWGIGIKSVEGPAWCTCASACFLVWASGLTRDGGHVGIHRLFWPGSEFGNLTPSEARARYEAAQAAFLAYLRKLDVPQTIIDRMFATDSQSMYYLTWPEHELMQSTPYLEEMTYSKCGKSKAEHMSRSNNWTSTEDPQHVNCYRGILKQIMAEGVKKYLETFGEGPIATIRSTPAGGGGIGR
jgi:hypothetical protein